MIRRARVRPRRRVSSSFAPEPGRRLQTLGDLQKAWWVVGIAGTLVAALGFQAMPPARRLAAVESANARQDSVLTAHVIQERAALDSVNRRLGQLLAGQCAKERDRLVRVLYAC